MLSRARNRLSDQAAQEESPARVWVDLGDATTRARQPTLASLQANLHYQIVRNSFAASAVALATAAGAQEWSVRASYIRHKAERKNNLRHAKHAPSARALWDVRLIALLAFHLFEPN